MGILSLLGCGSFHLKGDLSARDGTGGGDNTEQPAGQKIAGIAMPGTAGKSGLIGRMQAPSIVLAEDGRFPSRIMENGSID